MKSREVWLVDLDPTVGAEMQKVRPAIIVSGNNMGKLPLRVILPITEWKDRFSEYPWMIRLNTDPAIGITKESAADVFQIRSVSVRRLTRRIGEITKQQMMDIRQAVEYMMEDD